MSDVTVRVCFLISILLIFLQQRFNNIIFICHILSLVHQTRGFEKTTAKIAMVWLQKECVKTQNPI